MMPPILPGLTDEEYLQAPEYLAFRADLEAKVWELEVKFADSPWCRSVVRSRAAFREAGFRLPAAEVKLTAFQSLALFYCRSSHLTATWHCAYTSCLELSAALSGRSTSAELWKVCRALDSQRHAPTEQQFIPMVISHCAAKLLDDTVDHIVNRPKDVMLPGRRRVRVVEEGVVDV